MNTNDIIVRQLSSLQLANALHVIHPIQNALDPTRKTRSSTANLKLSDNTTGHFTQGRNVEIFGRRAKADVATLHRVFKWEWTRFLKNCKKIRNGHTLKILSFSPLSALKTLSVSYLPPLSLPSKLSPSLPWSSPGQTPQITTPSLYLFILSSLNTRSTSYPTRPGCLTLIFQLNILQAQSKPSSLMNFPPIPSIIQMDPNQKREQAVLFPLMASSPNTASGSLPSYFRLNYLPSIPASLIFLSFPST